MLRCDRRRAAGARVRRTAHATSSTLQAVAAVGQPRLMERFGAILAEHGLVAGQVLLTPYDFVHRAAVPARAGDAAAAARARRRAGRQRERHRGRRRDPLRRQRPARGARRQHGARRGARAAHRHAGLFTADPRLDAEASLIEEIAAVDEALEAVAGGTGTARGSGGMASKLAAAKIAAWSGVRAVIAGGRPARRAWPTRSPGEPVGTVGAAPRRSGSRAASCGSPSPSVPAGRVVVDDGARAGAASTRAGRCCRPACGRGGGLRPSRPRSRSSATTGGSSPRASCRAHAGSLRRRRAPDGADLPEGSPHEVVHRDDLVLLPD